MYQFFTENGFTNVYNIDASSHFSQGRVAEKFHRKSDTTDHAAIRHQGQYSHNCISIF